ncbi:MAG: diguanylate cyclase [Deltaproteobacteria bacterium]|nr:diguanylate cyclase [Deltaproteobacteria bacterium]
MTLPSTLWLELRGEAAAELVLPAEELVRMRRVWSIESAQRSLAEHPVEVVIVALPAGDAGAVLHQLLEGDGVGPASVIALCEDSAAIVSALQAGADDACSYARAPEQLMARLHAAARVRMLNVQADTRVMRELEAKVAELTRENQRLRELAHRDELTGLGNRRGFQGHIDYLIEYAGRFGGSLSVVMIDLDGMKLLNDQHGHAAGDVALRSVASVIRQSIRGVDVAARLGGDEFAVVMPATTAAAAARVAERIRTGIGGLALPSGARMSASFGVATLSGAPRGIGFAGDELMARADAALYAAKRAGKNRIELAAAA